LTLDPKVTLSLITEVPAAFRCGINEVLLTGFVASVVSWAGSHGQEENRSVLLDLEAHGREEIFQDVDLSHTIGWFTSMYPVRLELHEPNAGTESNGKHPLGHALKSIKEQLRRVPDGGLGYGMLRYLNEETGRALAQCRRPAISFNYLGRLGAAGGDSSKEWKGILGGAADSLMPMAHGVEVSAITYEASDGLRLMANWVWAPALLDEEQVREMAEGWFEALESLSKQVAQGGAGGLTPSDVPLVGLSQAEIELIERNARWEDE